MALVNSTNLLAVALVVKRSRDGPAFVFHYPPKVESVSDGPETPDTSELQDALLERLASSQHAEADGVEAELPKHWNHNDHVVTESGSQIVPWEIVAGLPAAELASVLTPARAYHKSLFQLCLDPLYCVSYPIHVPENGRWKKAKKNKFESHKSTDDLTTSLHDLRPSSPSKTPEPVREREANIKDEADEEKRSSMTMFSLVFILNPKKDQVKELVDSLYVNVVKKASKVYKYSQQHSDFVWKESKRILSLKDKAREDQTKMSNLWREILQTSSLAASMQDIYVAVSQNKIAALHLETTDGLLTPSFQIPAPFYIADLPPEDHLDQRGLWLTTANAFMSQDAMEEPGFLDRNFALLLMDDEKKIIAELQADPDPTTPSMVEFVQLSKPTMSFYQLGQSNVLSLGQVRKFAQHFIFWRRAIATPPLHARDVYIVSPNCDNSRLPRDSLDWQRSFPLAPPLPSFLAEISQSPRPYKHFCPSKVHRPTYILMLAWLMRRGWVTQLCTFAYVIVWPEIIYEVDYEIETEELAAAEKAREEAAKPATEASQVAIGSPEESPISEDDSNARTSTAVEHAAERARLDRIAEKASREAAEKAMAHSRRTVPITTSHPSLNESPHLADLTPHLILEPKKATGKESRYLSAIARRLPDDKVRNAWQLLCKYFDGRTALERIALQEDMKRKEVWNLLTSMTEYIMCTRHW